MTKDALLVGLNWTGENAAGYDVEPSDVKKFVEELMKK